MAKYVVNDTDLTAIANAIRSKSNTSETLIWPNGFKNAIDNISLDVEDVCIKTTDFDDVIKVDDAAALDARDIVMKIEPVQDLHGYDNPWPAGGGKNLLPCGDVFDTTLNGIRFTSDGNGKYTMSGTSTAAVGYDFAIPELTLPSSIYIHLMNNVATSQVAFAFKYGNTQLAAPTTNALNRIMDVSSSLGGQTIDTLRLYVTSGQTINITITPMILTTNIASEFVPYSNICPITGWTEATVTRTGKNLFNVRACTPYNQNVTLTFNDDGSMTCENRNNYAIVPTSSVIMNLPSGMYTVSTDGTLTANVAFYASDDGVNYAWYANGLSPSIKNTTITLDKPYVQLRWQVTENSTNTLPPIMLEYGSTYHSYEPYQGNTYDFTFPSGAGTVYGGTLDVTTGLLTVDRAMVDLGTRDWESAALSANGGNRFYGGGSLDAKAPEDESTLQGLICSEYVEKIPSAYNQAVQGITIYTNKSIQVYDSSRASMTAEEFKAEMSGVTLVYPLAIPATYQLTPQEIAMFKGTNILFSTTGKTQLKYFTEAFEPLAEELGL